MKIVTNVIIWGHNKTPKHKKLRNIKTPKTGEANYMPCILVNYYYKKVFEHAFNAQRKRIEIL